VRKITWRPCRIFRCDHNSTVKVRLLFAAALLLASIAPVGAANKTWLSAGGANATNWGRSQNWSPSGAPGVTDDIIIPTTPANGSSFPVLNATSTIATLTIQTGATLTGAAGFNLTVSGDASVAGTGVLNVNASTMSVGGDLSGTGTVNGNTGTLNLAGTMSVTTFNRGTGTVVYDGTAAQSLGAYTYNNLTIFNTSAAVSAPSNFGVNATFSMSGAATVLSPAAAVIVSGTGTLTGTGTVQVTRTAATADFNSQYTITNKTLTNLTVDYVGTAAQVVSARTYGSLSISNTNATVSAAANFSVNGTLTMNGAATVLNPAAGVVVSGTGTLTGTGTVQVTRTAATADFSSQYTISNKTLTNLTVDYAGTAAQTISALTYGDLSISNGNAAVSAASNFSVNGTLTMNGAATVLSPAAAVVVGGTGTLTGTGTVRVTRTAATAGFTSQYTISNKTLTDLTVEYNGAAAQNLSAITYGSLKINNANGVSLTAGNATASGTLTLTSGVVSTGVNILITTADCPGSVSRSSGHVAGLLRLHVPTGAPSCTFDIGDATNYRSIALTLPSVSTAGDLTATVSQAAGEHPNIASSGLDSTIDVNRFWTLTNSGIVLGANYSATFTFVAGDVDGGADPLTFEIERWDGSAWNTTTAAGTTATSTSASGIGAFSDFASGKKKFTAANGSFNAFQSSTAAGAISGVVKTKVSGLAFNDLSVVAIVGGAQFSGFNDSITIDLIGNNTTGVALDANNCPTTFSTVLSSFTVTINGGRKDNINFAAIGNSWRDVRVRVQWPTTSPTITRCSTDNFAVRPSTITISAHDATWETAGTTRALANTGATGGNVHKASTSAAGAGARPFTLRATANPASATNYDGSPTAKSGFPKCLGGSLCPNGVGALSFGSATWTGSGTGISQNATTHYSEAGTFNLDLEDATYAGVDAADSTLVERTILSTGAIEIGRFVPDRFVFSGASVPKLQTFGSSCAARSFTYIGQRFWFSTLPTATLSAVNAAGGITANYPMTTTKPAQSETYSDSGAPIALDTAAVGNPTLSAPSSGSGSYSAASSGALAYTRNTATPIVPFNAAGISLLVSASDADDNAANQGIVTTPTPLAFNNIAFDQGNQFRYGRMRLQNAAGPTTVDIPLTLRAEFYQSAGAGFVANSDDNCTPLAAGNFKLTAHAGSLTGTDVSVTVPASLTSGVASGMKLVKATTPVTGPGSVRVCFDLDSAPAAGDTACAAGTSANRSFLQGPWSAAGSYDKDPAGQVNVGTFGGQPNNFIFSRENY